MGASVFAMENSMLRMKYFFNNHSSEHEHHHMDHEEHKVDSAVVHENGKKNEQYTHPDTWKPYLAKKDYAGIVTMEFNEFITAERANNKEQAKMEAHHLHKAIEQYLEH